MAPVGDAAACGAALGGSLVVAAGDYALTAYRYGGAIREFAWTPVSVSADLHGVVVKLDDRRLQVALEKVNRLFSWLEMRSTARRRPCR